MRLVSVPGINGLGKTKGCENSFCGFNLVGEKLILNTENIETQLDQLLNDSKKYFESDEKVLFFGGDHSIGYPLVNNFFRRFGEDSKLIVFDAHPDLMEPMSEPGHEEWLRALIEKGFNPKNVLVVGVRRNSNNVEKKEIEYALKKGIKIIYSDEFDSRRGEISNFVSSGKIYCSIDIDVFDSSIISCTTYPEEEGLNEEEFFGLLREIVGRIDFFDLVEVNFEKGGIAPPGMPQTAEYWGKEKEKTKCVVGEVLKMVGAK